MHSNKGVVRIVGGKFRSRRLRIASRPDLRPTPDRVRETLFNWLGQHLDGLACLDLFAGSGALGFEAASRGAARVVMVEQDRAVRAELERSREELGAGEVEIISADAFAWLKQAQGEFDVVFLDPPFRQNAVPALLEGIAPLLKKGGRVYVESGDAIDVAAPWIELKRGKAGQVNYQLLGRDAGEEQA